MNSLLVFLLLLIIVGILGIIYILNYNQMQYLKTKIERSESVIDDSLRDKYDYINKLNVLIKKTLKDKKDYLKEYVNLKNHKISNFDLDRKLIEAMNIIYELENDYKELSNNNDFKDILKNIKATDEKLSAAKNYYNKYTSISNSYIRKFPSIIIAKIHSYKIKPFFDGKDMQDDIVDDFKL